jgi:parvulin-like peptidyl-prolyl isomerase
MPKHLTITCSDIIHNIKLSCQIPEIVEAIASQKIIAEAAKEAGIQIEKAELQQEGDKLRLEKKLIQAKDTWAWLKKHHLSLDDFEELIYNQVLSQKLANYLFSAHVEKFFYQHQLEYVAAVTYEVILEDRDLALELFFAVEEGEISFSDVARQYIQVPELRRAGGYQGVRRRQEFRPEIAAAVFAATPPQILKPITTPKGVYLIWVEEIIQPQLDEQLQQQIISELFSGWLKQQINNMDIAIELDRDINLQSQDEVPQQA